jgi:hypothetical protein
LEDVNLSGCSSGVLIPSLRTDSGQGPLSPFVLALSRWRRRENQGKALEEVKSAVKEEKNLQKDYAPWELIGPEEAVSPLMVVLGWGQVLIG